MNTIERVKNVNKARKVNDKALKYYRWKLFFLKKKNFIETLISTRDIKEINFFIMNFNKKLTLEELLVLSEIIFNSNDKTSINNFLHDAKRIIEKNIVAFTSLINVLDNNELKNNYYKKIFTSLEENHKEEDIVKLISESNDAEIICDYFEKNKKLSKSNIDMLTNAICNLNNPEAICKFANKRVNLSFDNVNELTKCICKIGSGKDIVLYASQTYNLNHDDIELMVNTLCKRKDFESICEFVKNSKYLTNSQMDVLTKAILESQNDDLIIAFIINAKNLSKNNLELIILHAKETYNVELFAKIMLIRPNIDYLKKVFKDVKSFINYCNYKGISFAKTEALKYKDFDEQKGIKLLKQKVAN